MATNANFLILFQDYKLFKLKLNDGKICVL